MQDGEKIQILTMEDVKEKMLYNLRNGLEKGSSTGIPEIDNCWKWRLGEFNVITGFSNEGKSEFFRFLMIIKVLQDGWKFVISAPEDWPAHEFFDSCIATVCGQSTDKEHFNQVSEEKYLKAFNLIKDHFVFVYIKPPDNTLEAVLNEMDPIIKRIGAKGVLLDPLVKFAKPKGMGEGEHTYAAYLTTMCTDFARNHKLSLSLVIHQVTPKPLESGFYPEPSMYNIRSGGIISDGTDNILFVQRPKYAKDKMDTSVLFGSQKIKKQKLVGVPQKYMMNFDRRANRYTKEDGSPLFDFTKYI